MFITGALFVAYVAVVVAVAAALVALSWPTRSRRGLRDTETPLIQAGYWSAALVPPAGLVIGVVTAARDDTRHGFLVMALAVLAAMLYLPVLVLFLAS